jgi:hypothetical protein
MAGLFPAIHVFLGSGKNTWMAGTRRTKPGMTTEGGVKVPA